MLEKLDVKPGDKVANYWDYGSVIGKIHYIFTVINITKKGTIRVGKENGERRQFDAYGYRKGRSSGQIRKLEEGEEEAFLAEKKEEWAAVRAKKEQEKLEKEKKLAFCYQWVLENAWPTQSIIAVNCTVYIISLPISKEPCTLVMRFDKTGYEGEYTYNVNISINHTRGDYISSGTTNTHSDKINPLEIAAEWMRSWADLSILKGETENVG